MSFSYLLCVESYTVVIIKKSANPANHYSGLALPLYTMDESALKNAYSIVYRLLSIFSVEVQVRVVN